MMKLAQLTLALLLSLVVLTQTYAADNDTTWYDIELILFKQGSASAANAEHWPADPGSPDWSNVVNLVPTGLTDTGQRRPYSLLPKESWRLRAVFNELRKTRGEMEPLFHQAWRQPVAAPKSAQSIYIGSNQQDGLSRNPFEGLIKISVNRYLHVDLDILLKNTVSGNTGLISTESASSPSFGSVRVLGKRRMRSGEVHYIDHPLMGALILISRIEEAPPAPEPTTVTVQPETSEVKPTEAAETEQKPAAATTN